MGREQGGEYGGEQGDNSRLVHIFHMHNMVVRADIWWEWVESESNPADSPSRFDYSLMAELGATWLDMEMLTIDQWDKTVHDWIAPLLPVRKRSRASVTSSGATRQAARRVRAKKGSGMLLWTAQQSSMPVPTHIRPHAPSHPRVPALEGRIGEVFTGT